MLTALRTLVIGIAVVGATLTPALAAPAKAPKPAVKTTVASAKDAFTRAITADLKRLAVGNQGGVLKIYDGARREVIFYRGLDDQATAPLSAADRARIFAALPVAADLDVLTDAIIARYPSLPKKEAIALLGVIGSTPSGERLSPAARNRILPFLVRVMRTDKDPVNRRQALLALALHSSVDDATVNEVVRYYEVTDNLWTTFPVQQFFAYQAATVKRLPDYSALWTRISRVPSLYHDNVVASLR